MKCILLLTIITLNGTVDNNTQPRSWQLATFDTIKQCKAESKYRHDFGKWTLMTDEQGTKQSKSECVCFE